MYFFVGGIIVSFLSFAFALLNFYSATTGKRPTSGLVAGHLGAMLGMAAGAFSALAGFVLLMMELASRYSG
jgi:hypothetical protein